MVAKITPAKLGCTLAILGAAAFSPAPINSGIPSPRIPEMTQEQLTKQQQFCGSIPVVGSVPAIQREGGLGGSVKKSEAQAPKVDGADLAIVHGSDRADKIGAAVENKDNSFLAAASLTNATDLIETQERKRRNMPLLIVLMLAAGYAAILLARSLVDKAVPVPKKIARIN